MKILFVQPSNTINKNFINSLFKKIKITSWPPLSLQQVAAYTPKEHTIKLIDDNFEKVPYDEDFDLIAITARTCVALRAYEIADEFRKRGKKVVIGGYHATGLPEEAKKHADIVVLGDAEGVWPKVIEDFEKGKTKDFYVSPKPPDPALITPPLRDFGRSYISLTATLQATRGCPHNCEFCALPNVPHGNILRQRPIENMIDEIKSIRQKFLVFVDSSISTNPKYFKELFKAMIPLKRKFSGFANINVTNDGELLELAKKAGCKSLSIGFDSVSQDSMNLVGKKVNKVDHYQEVVEKLHDYGISVIGCFIFGFDTDTKEIFKTTSDAISQLDLDCIRVNLLTPLPGTPVFKKMEKDGRILTRDWSKYDYQNVVFQPKNMTPEELRKGTIKVINDFFSVKNITKKIFKSMNKGFYFTIPVTSYLISSRIYHRNLVGLNPLTQKLGIKEIQV